MSKSRSVGTVLNINSKKVGALKSIGGIELSADTVDVSDLGNSTGYREFLQGFKDGGETALSGFYDGADEGQAEAYTLFESGEIVDCSIVFPAAIGKTWSFKAIVTKFATSADLDDAITFEASLKVSGKPTLAATETNPSQNTGG